MVSLLGVGCGAFLAVGLVDQRACDTLKAQGRTTNDNTEGNERPTKRQWLTAYGSFSARVLLSRR